MDTERVDDVIRVRYGNYASAVGTLLFPAAVAFMVFQGLTSSDTFSWVLWWIGTVGLLVSGAVRDVRQVRGLTLDVDGITWHLVELFIPWAQVTALEVDSGVKGSGKPHLIVRTTDPEEALLGRRGLARFIISGNIKQFAGPIAVKAHLLASPPEEVIAVADRLREAPAAPSTPAGDARRTRRTRARRIAGYWDFAAAVAVVAMALSVLTR
ncbi:hypothetical protein BZB76_2277 [Actinomadura pelletieri DSM 43383]|uniref:Uncharacterized protein n=1 Tax=Actinomadura pelletieri DSM 43383 TaxID=1120940 RepID=A0A495QTR3_9ACTN|nr:hypothetical protein [Actinomadura pelletieri]RKS76910.1 hypothetical protein BZB76_2277 [Actinomadura pelletieri DSM 43383]